LSEETWDVKTRNMGAAMKHDGFRTPWDLTIKDGGSTQKNRDFRKRKWAFTILNQQEFSI
jgi:hypothetical protein